MQLVKKDIDILIFVIGILFIHIAALGLYILVESLGLSLVAYAVVMFFYTIASIQEYAKKYVRKSYD